VALYQNDGSRHYIREYTVTSADTYEYITVTFPGDASGTINNDTGAGLDVYFPLVTGSTYQNTEDTWASGQDWSTSSAVNCMDNAANNFYLTGVQLEVGDVATDFAHEDYGTTLQKCERYFWRAIDGTQQVLCAALSMSSTTTGWGYLKFSASMRAVPTMAYSDYAHFATQPGGSQQAGSALALAYATKECGWAQLTWATPAGAVSEAPLVYSISASATLDLSAEL
jgi:hypothetical protein